MASDSIKYKVYLRKSEDDPKKQVRSIEDQKRECLEQAERHGIKISEKDIIIDERSAKRSGNRPNFTKLIDDIMAGKVQGIIAWHPDRLARNMKEGGEIIDLLDEGYIEDLKFASFSFTNDYNGKMTLGISFVLAKQYTDKLSEDVRRGLRRSLDEGRSAGQYKPGYIRSKISRYYEPDETESKSGLTMFALIKKAWRMKLEEKTNSDITRFLNDHGYRRKLKSSGKIQKMSDTKIAYMFKDPFYYGLLTQAGKEIDLNDIYEFTPMISEEEYYAIQSFKEERKVVKSKHYWPFKSILKCHTCKGKLSSGASKGRGGTRYLSYWCPKCKGGTIRAIKVIDRISKIIRLLEPKEDQYELYCEEARRALEKVWANSQKELESLSKLKRAAIREYEGYVKALALRGSKMNQSEIDVIEKEKRRSKEAEERFQKSITKLRELLDRDKEVDLENFLNTIKNLSTSLKFGPAERKDLIAKNMFLNILVKEGEIQQVNLKEPFATMCKEAQNGVLKGGGPGWI